MLGDNDVQHIFSSTRKTRAFLVILGPYSRFATIWALLNHFAASGCCMEQAISRLSNSFRSENNP